jgi:hypothetical protein
MISIWPTLKGDRLQACILLRWEQILEAALLEESRQGPGIHVRDDNNNDESEEGPTKKARTEDSNKLTRNSGDESVQVWWEGPQAHLIIKQSAHGRGRVKRRLLKIMRKGSKK